MPQFSIITVVYDAKRDLQKTVNSIREQNIDDYEHIIIDGKSTDGTVDYIKSLNYTNLKYLIEEDDGIYDAMNKGMKLSSAEYLLFLNAGDTFASRSTLCVVREIILRNKYSIIYGGANIYSSDKLYLGSVEPLQLNKRNLNLYGTRVVCHQSIFVHKNVVVEYSKQYKLKGELNWYYDLVERVKSNQIFMMKEMVCNYYLGGIGDREFFNNQAERFRVTRKRNSMAIFILTIPFLVLPYLFRVRRFIVGK